MNRHMQRNFFQKINRILKSVKKLLPNMAEQDKGTKRPVEEGSTDQQKKQKIEVDGKRVPKRKIAMLIGYNGKDYYGLQINKGMRTIESDILKALTEVECTPQEHADIPQKMSFQRACRTDKGVSAVCNVLSMKIVTDIENLIEKINSKLSPQIRVFGYKRTTKGFDSKNYVDSRTYMYICPTYAFAPVESIVTDEYRMTDDVLDHINNILKKFIGTHKFHNYTSQIKSTEARAKRYIISFSCDKPFIRDGCEFCVITVNGQSFMMHHIRKMIGMTIAIVRGNCGAEVIDKTWESERVDVPKAPGLGLCLDRPHYDNYNKRFGTDGIHDPLDWSEYQEEIDKFKEEYIYSDIMKTEKEEKVMMQWLGTLQNHQFDVCENEEERNQFHAHKRLLKKCKDNPDLVITPDSKKMDEEDNVHDKPQTEDIDPLNCKGDNSKPGC